MHKSALPVVIRQTLNSAAFDVKQTTMPAESRVFVHRKPTFFQANSKVRTAQGLKIDGMQATVGFWPNHDPKDYAVRDLEEQEHGGDIDGRSFIPAKQNRTGNDWNRNVRAKGRYRAVSQQKFVDADDSKGPNDAGKWHSSVKFAGVGGIVIGSKRTPKKGNRMVWRILSLRKKGKVKKQLLFIFKKQRKVDPKATHFMMKASLVSQKKMNEQFIKHAQAKILSAR